jgi:hypothetical protein
VRGTLATLRDKLLAKAPASMSAARCAAIIADGIARDRAIIPVTVEAHVAWRLARLSPWIANQVAQRLAGRVLAYAGADEHRDHHAVRR